MFLAFLEIAIAREDSSKPVWRFFFEGSIAVNSAFDLLLIAF